MQDGWLKENYPWIEEVQVFIASGGSYLGYAKRKQDVGQCEFDRDLFVDPTDRTVVDDYEFSPLVRACRNMLRLGVRPCLKLHAVPLKYTESPQIGWFRTNSRPPDDYAVYTDYISALVIAMVEAFGIDEVGRWRWFVGTEMENPMWWQTEDEDPESTMRAFCELYDWSVFAVERVLGESCGPVGSHAMMSGEFTGGLWDPEDFFKHCAGGKNLATGELGARLDFFAISYYDRAPCFLEQDEWNTNHPGKGGDLALFDTFASRTRDTLDRHGFREVPIEVSEGGILFGTDGKWLWHGLCPGGAYDASWTALSWFRLLENNVSLWSRWPILRTSGLFSGPEAASTHVLRIISRVSNEGRLPVHGNVPEDSLLQVVGSRDMESGTVHVLVFHHASDIRHPSATSSLSITLSGLPEGEVQVLSWHIDRNNGDFWPHWENDREAHGLSEKDFFRSRDQLDVLHALCHERHKALFKAKETTYRKLSRFPKSVEQMMKVKHGMLSLNCTMPCFSVRLLEIKPVDNH
jgi:xylan 1,4-beta-xylosidase